MTTQDDVTRARNFTEAITPVEALVELARSAREDPLEVVLGTVAETVHRIAGYEAVIVNVFRPAWDDYQVAVAIDTPEGVAALLDTVNPRATFDRLATHADERLPGVFVVQDPCFWEGIEHVYSGPVLTSDDPHRWRESDGLFVVLRDGSGAILGNLSIDTPVDGRRPDDENLRLLRAIASHAEHALDNARRNARLSELAADQARLLAATSRLAACTTVHDLLQTACDTLAPALGFERVAAYRCGETTGELGLAATAGWENTHALAAHLEMEHMEGLLGATEEPFGCWLLAAAQVFGPALATGRARSRRNGAGPAAWCDNCLIVPVRGPAGELSAVLAIEDPSTRLLPDDPKRRTVRLLADQISPLQAGIEAREQLAHLAGHDPLTGIRNRRNLTQVLEAQDEVALLICDLDEFKRINDRHGHAVGDRVLVRFGELLRELARQQDVPMRLGGEEFCLVLPRTDRCGAVAVAERLRTETARRMHDLVHDGVTVSIGVATTSVGVLDARGLLAAADRGLYAAKAAGRDRVVHAGVGVA